MAHIAEELEKKGIQVTIAVLIGNIAEEITHFAQEEKADLIVMASRGKTSLRRWDVGNAADEGFPCYRCSNSAGKTAGRF